MTRRPARKREKKRLRRLEQQFRIHVPLFDTFLGDYEMSAVTNTTPLFTSTRAAEWFKRLAEAP